MNKEIAVVLMSGGMDSALCAGIAQRDGYKMAALHLNYKQRTESRELKAFSDLSEHFNAKDKLVVNVEHLFLIGGSSLTDKNITVEKAGLSRKEIPQSYVPFRNANILSIAVSWAEVLGAKAIYIGATQADSSGYPDCRKEFFDAFQEAINKGTKPETEIKIMAPLINMTKKDIVLLGKKLKIPFKLTWSCYQEEEIACGECDSCALRLRGFQQAGIEDPIPYKIKPNYLD
ncbi:MAG: 7-cyano-7-deazaguanine synthase QueC [Ignavibacteria bacterium GWB2_35_12]|nr:MAG: 7-cyano-7-deazaguanine synthase QueC [Ignavibacteria bacterium GWA2_35_8]OGU42233.1 MAG: 7-cyano-7-deazaguanine synthase QueC [Ignavibacteria bacterium GWB2_35_12]OGV20072.1 MAG: 7-cyano-7-deazaguanine synthase QueC [Ignavibacteria bacterium RIFOXYC2_FULL_35_21]